MKNKIGKVLGQVFIVEFILLAAVALLAWVGKSANSALKPQTPMVTATTNDIDYTNMYNSTVMITNLQGTSGGSGTILGHTPTESYVLTNGHVCDVIKNGGEVHGVAGTYTIESYSISKIHDLCRVAVSVDLLYSASINPTPPKLRDKAIVVGHPLLLPTLITEGYFSQKQTIQVNMGSRPCTKDEKEDPNVRIVCNMFGQMPTTKSYEAIILSATSQPGSSGSPVFNKNGVLSGVVFAGANEFGYAFAVPVEFVINFLNNELPSLPREIPDSTLSFASAKSEEASNIVFNIAAFCRSKKAPRSLDQFCEFYRTNMIVNFR